MDREVDGLELLNLLLDFENSAQKALSVMINELADHVESSGRVIAVLLVMLEKRSHLTDEDVEKARENVVGFLAANRELWTNLKDAAILAHEE